MQTVDVRVLSDAQRERLVRLLSGDAILAERQAAAGGIAWFSLATIAAGAIALWLYLGVGVVETGHESNGTLALPLYGLSAMTLLAAALCGLRARRGSALPWPAGRAGGAGGAVVAQLLHDNRGRRHRRHRRHAQSRLRSVLETRTSFAQ